MAIIDPSYNITDFAELQKRFNYTSEKPEVSVIVTCYNHSDFIEECLISIFTQETDFLFEVLIGDDASTDDSLKKIQALAQNYKIPSRIFKWKADSKWLRNGKPNGRLNFIRLYALAQGKYFARCDGDDTWINSSKLQIQYDCIRNGGYNVVFGQSIRGVNRHNSVLTSYYAGEFTAEDLKWQNVTGYTSSSIFWRDENKEDNIHLLTNALIAAPYGDWTLQLLFLRGRKKGFIIDQPLIFYRTHAGGAFSSASKHQRFIDHHIAVAIHEVLFQDTPYDDLEFYQRTNGSVNSFIQEQFAATPYKFLSNWIIGKLLASRTYLIFRKIIKKIVGVKSRSEG